jgi:hypothetical protein
MQLQLELPDYSREYEEYQRKKQEQEAKPPETVIVIELF